MVDQPLKPDSQRIRDEIDAGFHEAVGHLENLVRLPSLSKPGAPEGPIQQSAEYVRNMFRDLVAWDSCEIVTVGQGRPAVIARKSSEPGKPTVLLYAHHDVQPPGDPSSWTTPAFEPSVRDGRLYGRGSADDGAGIITHWLALRAGAALDRGLGGLGVALFIEGEEESGSPTFDQLLETYSEHLRADVIIVADSDNPSTTTPALTTSLRGVVGLTVTVKTADFPVHSGMFGGVVPDALTVLVRLLATLHDDDHRVAVAGIGGNRPPVVGGDGDRLRRDAGVLEGVDLWGAEAIHQRLWWEPSLTITGIDATPVRDASNTLWPTAAARVSVRIPPDSSPQKALTALKAHLAESVGRDALLEFSDEEVGPGFITRTDHRLLPVAHAALEEAFGQPVVHQGVGGTIPFVSAFEAANPGALILITGVEDPESRAHSSNESVDLEMVRRCGLAEALFVNRVSSAG